jgi:hypothetical protein
MGLSEFLVGGGAAGNHKAQTAKDEHEWAEDAVLPAALECEVA